MMKKLPGEQVGKLEGAFKRSKKKQEALRMQAMLLLTEGRSLYGAVDITTEKCHLWDIDKQNSANTVKFLKQLEDYYQGKEVLLIWDGAPSHRGEVKQYLKKLHKQPKTYNKTRWKLQIQYFPPYSPKLNPQERIWKNAKQHITHNSEDTYEDKLYKFRQYIVHTKFNTNFLKKYS